LGVVAQALQLSERVKFREGVSRAGAVEGVEGLIASLALKGGVAALGGEGIIEVCWQGEGDPAEQLVGPLLGVGHWASSREGETGFATQDSIRRRSTSERSIWRCPAALRSRMARSNWRFRQRGM